MKEFEELVNAYGDNLVSNILLKFRNQEGRPLHHAVLLHKLDKYKDNPRKLALYIASFLGSYRDLPTEAKDIARRSGLVKSEHGVGYPHVDGSYHWFQV